MRALSPRVLRAIRDHFEAVLNCNGMVSESLLREWIAAIDGALRPKRGLKEARKGRVSKRDERRQKWDTIRTRVLERAAGVCEGCGQVDALDMSVDHMFGGNGRRRTLQSIYTCWGLCFTCHRGKTDNKPDAEMWLRWFIRHAKARMAQAEGLGEAGGYCAAAEIAQTRLDALEMMGRAG